MDQRGLARAVAGRTALCREEAADVTRAVLQGLAGQLSEGEARRLARDLPSLERELLAGEQQAPRRRRKEAHPVKVHDFVKQISERTGLTDEDSRLGLGAVLATLREALGEEDYGHLLGQLPREYAALAQV